MTGKIKKISLILLFSLFLFVFNNVQARQGCCSHHGGVCGCHCCDGTSLSATCAPYYPKCGSGTSITPTPVVPECPLNSYYDTNSHSCKCNDGYTFDSNNHCVVVDYTPEEVTVPLQPISIDNTDEIITVPSIEPSAPLESENKSSPTAPENSTQQLPSQQPASNNESSTSENSKMLEPSNFMAEVPKEKSGFSIGWIIGLGILGYIFYLKIKRNKGKLRN